jgi:hypothetical protein
MKVLCVIPLWHRPIVTEVCLRNLERTRVEFAINGIQFTPYCTVSDAHSEHLCNKYNLLFIRTANLPIGSKLDKAIATYPNAWDYYMGIGSDNVLTTEAVDKLSARMKAGVGVAGYQDMLFISGSKMKQYHSRVLFGAGRVVSRALVEDSIKLNGEFYGVKDRALDGASFRNIKRTGYTDFNYISGFDVIDIKGGECNINGYDAYDCREHPISKRYEDYL